jgi:GH15 family glucan-1,4-alpha-glucosidase
MSALLEDYGLIGDGRTAALICRDGSLDWLCWPRFDSDACFAALLGTSDHGRWLIAPAEEARITRRYLPDTLILETTFETTSGTATLIDFMPIGTPASSVVRLLVGQRGAMPLRLSIGLRFDYGHIMPWVEACDRGFVAKVGPDFVTFHAPVPITISHACTTAEFTVTAGQRLAFVLSYAPTDRREPIHLDVEQALVGTRQHWQKWIGHFDKPTHWPDAVRRSLLTLRALIHHPTGALVAAPTTSLPERPGSVLNWDYRSCWLRDAAFTLGALLNAGYHEEATAWRNWILRTVAAEPAKLNIMYRVDGGRSLGERTLDWLPGYRWATPVRVGNAAAEQHQGDVYGELIDTMELATRAGIHQSDHGRHTEREIIKYIEKTWDKPGQGMWESRGEPRHYTYPRVMAWVAVDRFLRSAARYGHAEPDMLTRLQKLCLHIHAEVCREGYDASLGTFVQHYGSQELDASLLMLPLVRFLPADDPRMARTITAIERVLMQDGLVMRMTTRGSNSEGAFLACTCWLADCRRLQGRTDAAREALERVLSVRNDLGLLSEEYNIRGRHLSGNFPQALSHLAVVNTALALSGPILQRGGA